MQKELQNLEDAGDELMLIEDDADPIPYPCCDTTHQNTKQKNNNDKKVVKKSARKIETRLATVH